LANGRPDLMYWLSHATPEALCLGRDEISPSDLKALLEGDDFKDEVRMGGLVFLNACRTAESGAAGSFFDALHECGLSGLVATEQQTVDHFASPLGLDFLEAFLDQGKPVGEILHRLRRRVPLGLLYTAYCPPDLCVRQAAQAPAGAVSGIVEAP